MTSDTAAVSLAAVEAAAVGDAETAASQLERARRIARTQARRDRQLVEIAAALVDGDADRASGLAAEHGRDFPPDEELLGTLLAAGRPSRTCC